jgi:hypothetical protein
VANESKKTPSQGAKAITLFFMDILPPHSFFHKPPAPAPAREHIKL